MMRKCSLLAILAAAAVAACLLPGVFTTKASAAVPSARVKSAERTYVRGAAVQPQFLGAIAHAVGHAVLDGFTGAVGGAAYKALLTGAEDAAEASSSSSSCAASARSLLRLERPSDAQFNASLR